RMGVHTASAPRTGDFDIFPVIAVTGADRVFLVEARAALTADTELLMALGGGTPTIGRRTAVSRMLDSWADRPDPRSSIVLVQADSLKGVKVGAAADALRHDWRRRRSGNRAWTILIVVADGAARFATDLAAALSAGKSQRLALIGVNTRSFRPGGLLNPVLTS